MIRLVSLACVACCMSWAQEGTRNRGEFEIPLPIQSPRAVYPGTIDPLTPEQKLRRAVRNTIGVRAIANRALIAGWNHWMEDPEEWGSGWDAYGQRFGSRMARLAVRQAVQTSSDIAFGIDPRYDRCDCTGFMARTGHAWRRVVVSRRDHGGEIFAMSNFLGAYVPPLITDQWQPASKNTWDHKWQAGTSFLAWRGGTNMLREFWPEIARTLRLKRSGGTD